MQIEYAAATGNQSMAEYRSAWFENVEKLMQKDKAKAQARYSQSERERLKKKIAIMCMM